METGRASKTALRVAMRRAAHQLLDQPRVLDDPIALPMLGSLFVLDREHEAKPMARAFRAFMAVRSRYAEDQLAAAAARGIAQYVVLGAGLDTFAWRNPFPQLRVFEVDFPATQAWKCTLLAEALIPLPAALTFVPLDFERQAPARRGGLAEGLAAAGFDAAKPAFFTWLGVVPYLTLDAFRATLETIAKLPAGTAVSFDYALPPETLNPLRRPGFQALSERVAAAGEPFRLFLAPRQLDAELRRAGFQRSEQRDSGELNQLYLDGRTDGLRLPDSGLCKLVTAWA